MNEVVSTWIEEFKRNDTSLTDEIKDVKASISNERLFLKGSSSIDDVAIHTENIDALSEYLEWLEEQL